MVGPFHGCANAEYSISVSELKQTETEQRPQNAAFNNSLNKQAAERNWSVFFPITGNSR